MPKRTLLSSTFTSSLIDNSTPPPPNIISVRSIKMEYVNIPKTGNVSEISAAVAKVLNESLDSSGSPVLKRQIDPAKLRVANIYMNRLNKLYTAEEAYTSHFEDIVVYEDDDCPVSTCSDVPLQTRSLSLKPTDYILPVFIREADGSSEISISRPFLINIKHLTYEDIREAIFQELQSLVSPDQIDAFVQAMNEEIIIEEKANSPSYSSNKNSSSKRQNAISLQDGSDGEAASEADEDEEATESKPANTTSIADEEDDELEDEDEGVDTNSYYNTRSRTIVSNPSFTISVVNMFATNEFSILRAGVKLDSHMNTFLSVNINTKIVSKFFPRELNNHKQVKLSAMMPPLNHTSLPKTSITLGECINQFTLTEKLGSDDPWYCPRCKKHQMASKKFDIW